MLHAMLLVLNITKFLCKRLFFFLKDNHAMKLA